MDGWRRSSTTRLRRRISTQALACYRTGTPSSAGGTSSMPSSQGPSGAMRTSPASAPRRRRPVQHDRPTRRRPTRRHPTRRHPVQHDPRPAAVQRGRPPEAHIGRRTGRLGTERRPLHASRGGGSRLEANGRRVGRDHTEALSGRGEMRRRPRHTFVIAAGEVRRAAESAWETSLRVDNSSFSGLCAHIRRRIRES